MYSIRAGRNIVFEGEESNNTQLFSLCLKATEYVSPATVSLERVEVLIGKEPKCFRIQSLRGLGSWDTGFKCTSSKSSLSVLSKASVAKKLRISIRSVLWVWGLINFLNNGSQFLITSGVPVLRMRLSKPADCTKEQDIASLYSPDNPRSIQTREKSKL